ALEDLEEAKVDASAKKVEKSASEEKAKEKVKLTYAERLEFEKLEKTIEELEAKKEALAESLSNTNNNDELMKISSELEIVVAKIEEATDRWVELAEWA